MRGVGEKLTANFVNGLGSPSVPIAMSPDRSGFGPQLTLSYDSGAGQGPLGLCWSLSLPSIARKTDKSLFKYRDAAESDVFTPSGAEDLVPALKEQGDKWVRGLFDRTVNNAASDAAGNCWQVQHCGSDGAHPGGTRAYRTNERSEIEPSAKSNP